MMSIPLLLLLLVDGLIIAALVMFLPRQNRSLQTIVQSATKGGVPPAGPAASDDEHTLFNRFQESLYWSKGLSSRSLLFVGLVALIPAVFGLIVVALASGGGKFVGLLMILLGPAIVYADSTRRASARRKQFQEALPPFLLTVASAMAAGLTLEQALKELSIGKTTVVEEEFHRATQGLSLGESLEDSLGDMANRMASADIQTMQRATAIGRQTGSSLTPILEAVAESALERSQVKREIGALTAEGMMSAYVVIALPFLVFTFLVLSQPGYISVLWTRPEGIAMGFGALVLIGAGWVWLRSLITKETSGL